MPQYRVKLQRPPITVTVEAPCAGVAMVDAIKIAPFMGVWPFEVIGCKKLTQLKTRTICKPKGKA